MTREEAFRKLHEAVGHLCRKMEQEVGRGPMVCMTIDVQEALDILSRPAIELSEGEVVVLDIITPIERTMVPTEPDDRIVVLRKRL